MSHGVANLMLPLVLGAPPSSGFELLCIGAHSDDLELGCSGAVMELIQARLIGHVTWVVLSGNETRAREAALGAQRVLGAHPTCHIIHGAFRDGFLPYQPVEVKEFFEELKQRARPDLIFTHYREDRHQDHRLASDLTYNTFRNHLILEYEIMKIDGDLGQPNLFVPLSPATVDEKVRLLMDVFGSQRDKAWFSEDAFRALMRLRGIEARSGSGLAEAFYVRALNLGVRDVRSLPG